MAKELTVGEMAHLCGVTTKTLYLYHEQGILSPARVDELTGYRYYTYHQCSTIIAIKQLQSIGMSLDEIKMVQARGSDALYELLERHTIELKREVVDAQARLRNAHWLLRRKDGIVGKEEMVDQVMFERLRPVKAACFGMKDGVATDLTIDPAEFNDQWEVNLCLIRRRMDELEMPPGLFINVGAIVSHEDLLEGRFVISTCYVTLGGLDYDPPCDVATIPGGEYLVLYRDRGSEGSGKNLKVEGIKMLIDFAADHGVEPSERCYLNFLNTPPGFRNTSDSINSRIKIMMPVERGVSDLG